MTDPDALRGLLERATHDIKEGWPEAAYDSIVRVMRLAIAEELAPLRLALERIEAAQAPKLPAGLQEHNRLKGSDREARRMEILAILGRYTTAPSPKAICGKLRRKGFEIEPSTIEEDLRAIRRGWLPSKDVQALVAPFVVSDTCD